MLKYEYLVDGDICMEPCKLCIDSEIRIGSNSCIECEFCYGHDRDEKPSWIKCSRIGEAVGGRGRSEGEG